MQHRGRSRNVSLVALARQASEERRLSLEDQIQAAYAHDNIRLAKVLLLRLNGIHVSTDNDPRIDQVRDEDFDVCFAPSGPLALDTRAVQETQHRWHESQRTHRLRVCEKLWEDEKLRLHEEKLRAMHRREQLALDHERARLAEKQRHTRSRPETHFAKREQDPFQYTFMPPSKPSLPCRSSKAPKKTLSHSAGSHNRSVSFKEVINAMNGKLFPPDPSERADDARRLVGMPIANPTPNKRRASVRAELLDSLLQVVEWQEGERRRVKGKEVVPNHQTVKSPVLTPIHGPSAPSSSLSVPSISSSVSSPPSRSSSWLSFGSWRSTTTDFTAPESPVLPSPTSSQPCLLPTLIEYQRELHPRCAFVRISLEESPLCPPATPHRRPVHDDRLPASPIGSADLVASLRIQAALVKRVTRSVASIVEVAKGLQSAYIIATMFTAGPTNHHDPVSSSQPHRTVRCQRQLRRDGYRALAKDVQAFTDSTMPINHTSEPVHFIPLVSLPSGTAGLPKPPVPKNVIIIPSPLRPRTPPAVLAYRMRPVANPAVLRLRALQNLMCARGKEWEGRAREGGLGCGKERMLGMAFEGRGRSGLGCEVRFVVV